MSELRCYVCDRRAPLGAVGWETGDPRQERCPRHRQERPRAIATLGELAEAHRRKLAAVLCVFLVGCTDEEGSRRALEGAGFTEVQLTGFEPFACGRDDNSATGFEATNARGKRVRGVVCCGVFKNCTVRF